MNTVEGARDSYSAFEEYPSLKYAAAATTALAGYATGYAVGAASTLTIPIETSPIPGVRLSTTANLGTNGADIQTIFGEVDLPYVQTPVGVEVAVTRADINFKSHDTINKALTLAGNPKIAVDQIKDSLHAREIHAGEVGAGVFLLAGPVAFYAMKRLVSRHKIKKNIAVMQKHRGSQDPEIQTAIDEIDKLYSNPKKLGARRIVLGVLAGASVLVGCGGAATTLNDNEGFGGKKVDLPAYITNESPFLKGANIRSQNAQAIVTGLKFLYNNVSKWETARDTQSHNLEAKLKEIQPELKNIHADPNNFTVLHLTGTLCNYGFLDRVLKTLSDGTDPQVTLDTGDIFSDSGSTPLESGCYKDLAQNSKGRLIVVLGNHDPKNLDAPDVLGPSDDYTEVVDGMRFVGTTDPRSHLPNTPDPIHGASPKATRILEDKAFGAEGSKLASEACKYKKIDGKSPIEAVHFQSGGYETEQKACASVVDSDHGRLPDPQFNPSLRAFKGNDGKITFQNTGISASGYYGVNLIASQKNLGSASFQVFDKKTGDLTKQINFLFEPGDTIQVQELSLPAAEVPTAAMNDFLIVNSTSPSFSR